MKQKKIIIGIIIAIIIVVILDILLVSLSKKEEKDIPPTDTPNIQDQINENHYHCISEQKDIQLALVDSYYNFEYDGVVVKNQKQGYVFRFKNKENYNRYGKKELFTKENPENMKEILDEENLKKTYEKVIGPSDFVEETDIETFIKKIESYGYNCSKE